MLDSGVVTPPSKYEAHFVSAAHTKDDMDKTLEIMDKAFEEISKM